MIASSYRKVLVATLVLAWAQWLFAGCGGVVSTASVTGSTGSTGSGSSGSSGGSSSGGSGGSTDGGSGGTSSGGSSGGTSSGGSSGGTSSGGSSSGGGAGSTTFTGWPGASPYTGANQGFAINPNGEVYTSGSAVLTAYDSNWNVLWQNTAPFAGMPPGLNHIGDIAYDNGYIYAPVQVWDSGGCSTVTRVLLAVYSASTGALVTWRDITAQQPEAAGVTIVPGSTNEIVTVSYCSTTFLWHYDLDALMTGAEGTPLTSTGTTTLSDKLYLMQGISWNGDAQEYAIATDIDGVAGSIFFASATGVINGPVYVVPASEGTELEGLDYTTGSLYYLEHGYIYGIGPPTPPPTFSVAAGTYATAQTVTITDSDPNAVIYYTTNGRMPNSNSTPYTAPINIKSTTMLRAVAIDSTSSSSAMVTATYTIQ